MVEDSDRERSEDPSPAAGPPSDGTSGPPEPSPRPPPATAPPGPAPRVPTAAPTLMIVVFLGLCLVAGVLSLVHGPRTPAESEAKEEVEILDGDPFSAALGFTPEGVALVHVYGAISFSQEYYGAATAADATVRTLRKLRKLSSVKAVVLRVNSPGGTVASSEAIHRQVLELREAGKKVVVSMADMAASGGYYISAPADYIFANGGTITGSIGVITQLPRYKEAADKIGIDFVSITSGPYKDMGNPFREITPEEEELFRTTIMNAYLQFVDVVAEGRYRAVWQRRHELQDDSGWQALVERLRAGEDDRPLRGEVAPEPDGSDVEKSAEKGVDAASVGASEETSAAAEDPDPEAEAEAETGAEVGDAGEKPGADEEDDGVDHSRPDIVPERVRQRVAALADGRIYIGLEAVRLGLVDEIGTLQDALDKAGELSGLGKNPRILKPKGPNELHRFMQLVGARAQVGPLDHLMRGVRSLLGLDAVGRTSPGADLAMPMPVAYLWSGGR